MAHCYACDADFLADSVHVCPVVPPAGGVTGGSATSGDPESAQLALPGGRVERIAPDPKVSVGRIVHYYRQFKALVPPAEREPQAAIVTRSHGAGMVELQVFGMAEPVIHRTVPFSPIGAAGCWTWPPRT